MSSQQMTPLHVKVARRGNSACVGLHRELERVLSMLPPHRGPDDKVNYARDMLIIEMGYQVGMHIQNH